MVVIDLAADENAQEIFETLNARGAQLTAADLIKNFVFQRLLETGANVEDEYQRNWRDFESGFWETEISVGRLRYPRSAIFLNHWLIGRQVLPWRTGPARSHRRTCIRSSRTHPSQTRCGSEQAEARPTSIAGVTWATPKPITHHFLRPAAGTVRLVEKRRAPETEATIPTRAAVLIIEARPGQIHLNGSPLITAKCADVSLGFRWRRRYPFADIRH
jgi:hypothetical protein